MNPVASGNWGGLVFRQDSDLAAAGIFLNYVDNAQITYGGGQVVVNSQPQVFDPIHIISSRPTITFNTIANNADAAMSADPNSFQETEFQGPTYDSDYSRVGPMIHGNVLSNDSINGLFVRIRTDPNSHQVLDPLTVSARFTATDIVYVLEENLVIQGQPGGFFVDCQWQAPGPPERPAGHRSGRHRQTERRQDRNANRRAVHRRGDRGQADRLYFDV